MLQQAILSYYHKNCPARLAFLLKMFPWCNKELSYLQASTRLHFNQARRTGHSESYKTALTCFNKEIREAKWSFWRDYCQEIKDVPDRVIHMKIMATQSANKVESITLPYG
jgi:hypothetical protein